MPALEEHFCVHNLLFNQVVKVKLLTRNVHTEKYSNFKSAFNQYDYCKTIFRPWWICQNQKPCEWANTRKFRRIVYAPDVMQFKFICSPVISWLPNFIATFELTSSCRSLHPSIRQSVHLSVHPFAYPPVSSSIRSSVHSSIDVHGATHNLNGDEYLAVHFSADNFTRYRRNEKSKWVENQKMNRKYRGTNGHCCAEAKRNAHFNNIIIVERMGGNGKFTMLMETCTKLICN